MPGKDREGRQARHIAVTRRQRAQLSLLEPRRIAGFDYQPELISPVEEKSLVEQLSTLAFEPFEFHGYLGHRRVASFGVRYGFDDGKVHAAPEIPHFLLPLRQLAAAFARIDASALQHALVTEYRPGAGIGWHRDRPVFQDVIGVSLVSPCRFRLRRRTGAGWKRETIVLEPRSAYLLRGPVRADWQHSIPPAESLRYSVTFRSLKEA